MKTSDLLSQRATRIRSNRFATARALLAGRADLARHHQLAAELWEQLSEHGAARLAPGLMLPSQASR